MLQFKYIKKCIKIFINSDENNNDKLLNNIFNYISIDITKTINIISTKIYLNLYSALILNKLYDTYVAEKNNDIYNLNDIYSIDIKDYFKMNFVNYESDEIFKDNFKYYDEIYLNENYIYINGYKYIYNTFLDVSVENNIISYSIKCIINTSNIYNNVINYYKNKDNEKENNNIELILPFKSIIDDYLEWKNKYYIILSSENSIEYISDMIKCGNNIYDIEDKFSYALINRDHNKIMQKYIHNDLYKLKYKIIKSEITINNILYKIKIEVINNYSGIILLIDKFFNDI